MITKALKIKKGFTLVETLVAIAIIVIALVGPFESVQHALIASYVARDELIGNSLAQEGVEMVRARRDINFLSGSSDWLLNLDGSPNCFSNLCSVDPSAVSPIAQCSGSSCTPLYVTPAYIYTQISSGNIQSRFTRSIQLCYMQSSGACTTSSATNEVKVTATVMWTTSGVAGKAIVTDYLQNWL